MPEGKITRIPTASSATSAYRRWQLCWGATPAEVAGSLPGDDMCPSPRVSFTRAITIAARPDEVWPWLVQVGFGPHGRYSYGVDSSGVDSSGVGTDDIDSPAVDPPAVHPHAVDSETVDSETVDAHDVGVPVIPTRHAKFGPRTAGQRAAARSAIGAPTTGPTRPDRAVLHIVSFQRPEWLLWETAWGSWVWVLRPVDATTTRLITRGRQRHHIDPALPRGVLPTEDADFRLVRTMLTGIKRRSEAWAAECNGRTAG